MHYYMGLYAGMEADLADGRAGQALALLTCLPVLPVENAQLHLQKHIQTLLAEQLPEGCWLTSHKKQPGFSHGCAGITTFLLAYYKRFPDKRVGASVRKALGWLQHRADGRQNYFIRMLSKNAKPSMPWLHDGSLGVALCFIRAFETLGDSTYQQQAEAIFNDYPHHPFTGRSA